MTARIAAPQGLIPRGRYYIVDGDAGRWLIPFEAVGIFEPSRLDLAAYPGNPQQWAVHDVMDGRIPEE